MLIYTGDSNLHWKNKFQQNHLLQVSLFFKYKNLKFYYKSEASLNPTDNFRFAQRRSMLWNKDVKCWSMPNNIFDNFRYVSSIDHLCWKFAPHKNPFIKKIIPSIFTDSHEHMLSFIEEKTESTYR